MKHPLGIIALAMFAIGCASGPDLERATLDGLDYAVPAGWNSKDLSELHRKIVVWTPMENPRRESVTLMRSEPLPALAKAGPGRLERWLVEAQGTLPRGQFGPAKRFTTKRGLPGVRLEGEFVPTGAVVPYRRFHAVVLDGTSLVHVLYTASIADREAFDTVLDSLHRKAA